MGTDPNETLMDDTSTLPTRLWSASEQIRLTATALASLAELVDEQDTVLSPHVERLQHRAAELMRTALRLARDLGVDGPWALDILFTEPEAAPLARGAAPADESIELDPLELLAPIAPPAQHTRRAPPSQPPWMPLAGEASAPLHPDLFDWPMYESR